MLVENAIVFNSTTLLREVCDSALNDSAISGG